MLTQEMERKEEKENEGNEGGEREGGRTEGWVQEGGMEGGRNHSLVSTCIFPRGSNPPQRPPLSPSTHWHTQASRTKP